MSGSYGCYAAAGFSARAACLTLQRFTRSLIGCLLAIEPAYLTVYFISTSSAVAERGWLVSTWQWSPELSINLSFALDGLSLMFALLICGIAALVELG
jgi:multicomponent Na+:H+ antiporter subunit A